MYFLNKNVAIEKNKLINIPIQNMYLYGNFYTVFYDILFFTLLLSKHFFSVPSLN